MMNLTVLFIMALSFNLTVCAQSRDGNTPTGGTRKCNGNITNNRMKTLLHGTITPTAAIYQPRRKIM